MFETQPRHVAGHSAAAHAVICPLGRAVGSWVVLHGAGEEGLEFDGTMSVDRIRSAGRGIGGGLGMLVVVMLWVFNERRIWAWWVPKKRTWLYDEAAVLQYMFKVYLAA